MERHIRTLWGPQLLQLANLREDESNFQVSVHFVQSKAYLRELQFIFPNLNYFNEEASVIVTMQRALVDLSGIGEAIEKEKDRLLENVILDNCLKI
jgi:hypothetical protein